MKKTINIYMSNKNAPQNELKAFFDVKEDIQNNVEIINTNCLTYFCFDYLDKGYDVFAIKSNGDYVSLAELLGNVKEHNYIDKEIRRAHNAQKMLVSGALRFRNNIKDKGNEF